MKRLTGMDASFLYLETPTSHMHVAGLNIYDPSEMDERWDADRIKLEIERRLHLVPPFRRRLKMVPFGLHHPLWIEDPDFDLDYHVRHAALPSPGRDDQLADLVARVIARPLDRNRPLWETYVIEGLPDRRFAILTKIHHATVDGASGAELLTMMLDEGPVAEEVTPPDHEWEPEPLPSAGALLARTGINLARKPGRFLVLGARTVREVGRATRNPVLVGAANQFRDSLRGPLGAVLNVGRARADDRDPPPPMPTLRAPRTPFNGRITAHRKFAFRSTELARVKDIKNALGATVNDVVMAACAGGLRAYLDGHDQLPDEPLVAMVPVSIRTGEEEHRWTNRVSGLLAVLPTDEPDPLERVRKVHESMELAKGMFQALPAESLTEFSEFPPPAVFARAMRMATRLSTRTAPPANLVISNVPGPRNPLYVAGSRLTHYYPVSTIVDGQGLNITVQSYLDTLDFGLVSCRELVPDLWDLVDLLVQEVDVLAKAAGLS